MFKSGKRRRNTKKISDIERMVSFKPFSAVTTDEQDDEEERVFPALPDEDEFLSKVPTKLFPHQVQALRWMYDIESEYTPTLKNVGGILADVMGLGKTIDALGLIYYDVFKDKKRGFSSSEHPTLVVTPLTLMDQWHTEATTRLGLSEEEVFEYHGTGRTGALNARLSTKRPAIVITTYETVQKDFLKRDKSPLYKTTWSRVFLDEAHVARNPKTKTFRALKQFKTKALWCITGTPIVNYPDDVRMLSILCTPNNPLDYTSAIQEMTWKRKYLLRRTKDLLDLPQITYKDEWIDMSPEEFEEYRKIEDWAQSQYDQLVQSEILYQQYQKILLVLVRLRQQCDHPALQQGHSVTSKMLELLKEELGLMNEPEDDSNEDDTDELKEGKNECVYDEDTCFIEDTDSDMKKQKKKPKKKKRKSVDINDDVKKSDVEDEVIEKDLSEDDVKEAIDKLSSSVTKDTKPPDSNFGYSSKMLKLLDILETNKQSDPEGKTVVFSQFTTMLDLIECMLIKKGYKVVRFDGRQQKTEIRKHIIRTFKTDPSCTVLLASLKAGGVGLNLLPARYLVLMDPWWNSSVEFQAYDRVHRIGQDHKVIVYKILVNKTIEEEVLKIQKKKQVLESRGVVFRRREEAGTQCKGYTLCVHNNQNETNENDAFDKYKLIQSR